MKIRRDFVTNSSSSSYIIAVRKFPEIDCETESKYPFIKVIVEFVKKRIVKSSNIASSKEELDKYFHEEYVWDDDITLEDFFAEQREYTDGEECFYERLYKKLVDYINKDFKILFKEIDYEDETTSTLIEKLENDDFVVFNL